LRQAVERLEKRNEEWASELRALRGDSKSLNIVWPVRPEDIIAADWRKPPHSNSPTKHNPPYIFNWVIPPMGQVSGGNVTIFRTIAYLESKGHKCRVYFYDARGVPSFEDVKKV